MNIEFDFFGELLFDEAKSFLEDAKNIKEDTEKQKRLHASLLIRMSALEAYVNSICEELISTEEFNLDIFEKSVLGEKNIEIQTGRVLLTDKLKMARLIDRIELIVSKFKHRPIDSSVGWNMGIKQTIDLRNNLVHPKQVVELTENMVERSLWSVLETINELFNAVYKRNVPMFNYGLLSVK